MTYRQYLDSFLLPYDDSMEPEAEKRNLQVKKRRQELKRCFTEEGQPGEMFVGVHKQLCKKLALPENEAIGEDLIKHHVLKYWVTRLGANPRQASSCREERSGTLSLRSSISSSTSRTRTWTSRLCSEPLAQT